MRARLALFFTSPLLAAGLLAPLGCSDDPGAGADKPDLVVSDVLNAVADRTKLLRDYTYSGVATTLIEGGQSVEFTYALKQPGMLRADVPGINQSFLYDGKMMGIIDRSNKRLLRQDMEAKGKKDPAGVIAAIHTIFGDYVCEGWEPPMLRTGKGKNTGKVEKGEAGEVRWIVSTSVDDADLKEVRYTLRAPKADFISKEWINKDGTVFAATRMLEEHTDERTKLSFPKVWEHSSPSRRYKVEIKDIAINGGLTAERFQVVPPEGFTVQKVGQ
jgi:outer membrane lipoprotein-sorting protein